MGQFINCRQIAADIKAEVKKEVANLSFTPKLAIIQVGDNEASNTYIRGKTNDCIECGFDSVYHALDETTTTLQLVDFIASLNMDHDICGIIVQMPVPDHIDMSQVVSAIRPEKDVDGLTSKNTGELWSRIFKPYHTPCTAAGVIEVLKRSNVKIDGAHAVILGRSDIVGRPVAAMLLDENATVTMCHTHTPDIMKYVNDADIVVAATGNANLINSSNYRPKKVGNVLIDVGINYDDDHRMVGDIEGSCVYQVTLQTPVPGGIGLITRAMLMKNMLQAARYRAAMDRIISDR